MKMIQTVLNCRHSPVLYPGFALHEGQNGFQHLAGRAGQHLQHLLLHDHLVHDCLEVTQGTDHLLLLLLQPANLLQGRGNRGNATIFQTTKRAGVILSHNINKFLVLIVKRPKQQLIGAAGNLSFSMVWPSSAGWDREGRRGEGFFAVCECSLSQKPWEGATQLIQEVTRFHLCLYRFEGTCCSAASCATSVESVGTNRVNRAHACRREHNGVTARGNIERRENNRLANSHTNTVGNKGWERGRIPKHTHTHTLLAGFSVLFTAGSGCSCLPFFDGVLLILGEWNLSISFMVKEDKWDRWESVQEEGRAGSWVASSRNILSFNSSMKGSDKLKEKSYLFWDFVTSHISWWAMNETERIINELSYPQLWNWCILHGIPTVISTLADILTDFRSTLITKLCV